MHLLEYDYDMNKQLSGKVNSMVPKPEKAAESGVEPNGNTVVDTNLLLKQGSKILFLEKCLYEFCKRLHMLHGEPPNRNQFQSVTFRLRDILEIYTFYPNNDWFMNFKKRHDLTFSSAVASSITPRLGTTNLDLHEIVRFCTRSGQKKSLAHKKDPVEIIEISSDEDSSKAPLKRKIKMEHNASQTFLLKKTKLQTQIKTEKASELPRNVHSYEDALCRLKPIDQFARKEKNFEAIAIISKLEKIFKAGENGDQKKVITTKQD